MGRGVSYASGSVAIAYKDVTALDVDDWDWYVSDLKERIAELWPSMQPCDNWLGREDRAIMRNNMAYIGVSEYCGLCSIWLVPRDDEHTKHELAKQWCANISKRFLTEFGELVKLGTFSNGESVFQRRA